MQTAIYCGQGARERGVEGRWRNKHRYRRGHGIIEGANAKNHCSDTKRGFTDVKKEEHKTNGKQKKGYLDEQCVAC